MKRRRSKASGPTYLQGELRDLPPAKSVAESQAEREAFFERAWAQKAAREARQAAAGKPAPANPANPANPDAQAAAAAAAAEKRRKAEEERVARAKRIAAALSDSDSD